MNDTFFKSRRDKLFPNIDNWNDPQGKYKKIREDKLSKEEFDNLTRSEWFWFHPSAHLLIWYGKSVFMIINSIILIVLNFIFWRFEFIYGVSILFILIFGYDLFKQSRNYKNIKNITMFDVYLKDYEDKK